MATKKHDSIAKQEVNSPLIITTGIISVLLLIVSSIGLEAWFRYEEEAELTEKWQVNQNTWLADIRSAEAKTLGGAKHDPTTKTNAVPIDVAMQAVAQNQGKTK